MGIFALTVGFNLGLWILLGSAGPPVLCDVLFFPITKALESNVSANWKGKRERGREGGERGEMRRREGRGREVK